MLALSASGARRACVFTGPVLTADDPEIVNASGCAPVQVPAGFWKVVVVARGRALRAAAFLAWQRDYDRPRPVSFEPLTEQVRLTTIEVLAGLSFPALREADPLRPGDAILSFGGDEDEHHPPAAVVSPRNIVL